jgi:hypothetical protein
MVNIYHFLIIYIFSDSFTESKEEELSVTEFLKCVCKKRKKTLDALLHYCLNILGTSESFDDLGFYYYY